VKAQMIGPKAPVCAFYPVFEKFDLKSWFNESKKKGKTMRKEWIVIGGLLFGLILAAPALAHTPLCSCYDNGDGTITCEGGFSDGSSAAGVQMRVEDPSGKVLIEGKMGEFSEFTFDKPAGAYKVVFDAGEGHAIEIDGKEIVE
jgi:hypothetical protein